MKPKHKYTALLSKYVLSSCHTPQAVQGYTKHLDVLISAHKKALNELSGVERARALHDWAEEFLEEDRTSLASTYARTSCLGCRKNPKLGYCCSYYVWAGREEVLRILDHTGPLERFLGTHGDNEAAIRMRTHAHVMNTMLENVQHSPDVEFLLRVPKELRMCPFYNQDTGECVVYPVRPLTCRKHYIVGDVSTCDMSLQNPLNPPNALHWVAPLTETLLSAYQGMQRGGNLSVLLMTEESRNETI